MRKKVTGVVLAAGVAGAFSIAVPVMATASSHTTQATSIAHSNCKTNKCKSMQSDKDQKTDSSHQAKDRNRCKASHKCSSKNKCSAKSSCKGK